MTSENSFGFLRSSTYRLALTYLSIIMLMSIGFSFVFYNTSTHQLGRQLPPREIINKSIIHNGFSTDVQGFFKKRISEGRHELLIKLLWLNVLTLGGGAAVSYLLARRTLLPIEDAMEDQTQFVSDASHELRTPLTGIRTSNEVALRKAKLTIEDAKNVIKQNIEDVIKLQSLTDDLLRLANNNDDSYALSPIALQEIVGKAMNQVIAQAQAKDITVNDEVDNVTVLSNKKALVQIITILLDNAIKYSDPKSTITLNSKTTDRFIHLHIRDQGIGISEEAIPHIFKRFYRADQSRSKDHRDGYGLGLSIAAKLAEQIQSEITVESTIKKGAVFTIRLPTA